MHHQQQEPAADILSRQETNVPQPPQGPANSTSGPTNHSGRGSSKGQIHQIVLKESLVVWLENALREFRELELDGDEVTPELFSLPLELRDLFRQCANEVHYGTGICIIRGLKPDNYSIEDNIILFLGIASHIGDQRGVQNSKGDMLSHVTDSKSWTVPKEKRHGIHTNGSLPFHNDMGCEILSIQVRDRADAGGHTCVASISAIYNDLVQSNPWALHVLSKPNWPIQTSSKKDPPFILCPLLEFHAGNLLVSMDPSRIGPHPLSRPGSIPYLTLDQQEALTVLQKVAKKHQVRLDTQPGDLVFINNLGLLHSRESYIDGASSSRHLVRLWLRSSLLGWPIPSSMKMPWDAAFGERAARIINRQYPIAPMPEYMECKYSSGTAAFVAEDDSEEGDSGGITTQTRESDMCSESA
ncbi:hypothetical protein M426DRAFT_17521 [Hypoxylon sp. CI-4A]|nr:hypothetical protein M426DRAFT_17521 [Hypoxylon sp. CI-4A]